MINRVNAELKNVSEYSYASVVRVAVSNNQNSPIFISVSSVDAVFLLVRCAADSMPPLADYKPVTLTTDVVNSEMARKNEDKENNKKQN